MTFPVLRSFDFCPSVNPCEAHTSQAMLYAAGVPDKQTMKTAPHVGIVSVWWEGNPCNMHLLDLGKEVKKAVINQGMLGWQYNTVGVSDAITMGGEGLSIRQSMPLCRLIDSRYEVLPPDSGDHRRQHRNGHLRSISRCLYHHPRL